MNRRLFTRCHLNSIFLCYISLLKFSLSLFLVFLRSCASSTQKFSSSAKASSSSTLSAASSLSFSLPLTPCLSLSLSRLLQLFNFFGFKLKLKFLQLLLSNFRLSYRLSGSQDAVASPVTNTHMHTHTRRTHKTCAK